MSFNQQSKLLSVEIAGIRFNNPVLTASGTCGYGLDMAGLIDLNKLGGVCTKGLSAKPMRGNTPWRIVETHGGMLNAIGLQNIGARAFVEEKLPELKKYDTRVIPNVFGYTIEEYIEAIEILEEGEGIHGYELNISCPNVKAGGESFANDARQAATVTEAVKRASTRPVVVKLSPNVTDVAAIARAVEDAGADALSLVNTAVGMAIDINTATAPGKCHRRVVRPSYQADRCALRFPGFARGQDSADRHRRNRDDRRRARIHHRRSERGAGRHGELLRSGGDDEDC